MTASQCAHCANEYRAWTQDAVKGRYCSFSCYMDADKAAFLAPRMSSEELVQKLRQLEWLVAELRHELESR